jgi:hypothetical protein
VNGRDHGVSGWVREANGRIPGMNGRVHGGNGGSLE